LLVETVVVDKIAGVVEVELIAASVVEVDIGVVVESVDVALVLKDGVDRETCGVERDVSVGISVRVTVGLEKFYKASHSKYHGKQLTVGGGRRQWSKLGQS